MKRILFISIALFVATGALLAQYYPTTVWPYVNNNFSNANIYLKSGEKLEYFSNIHLQGSVLHYVKNNNVMEAAMSDILLVEIDSKKYMNINNSLMEIICENKDGFVAMLVKPDYTRLNETGGAYGSSSNTTSTKALTSLEGIGSITNHMLQQADKENGKEIPLLKEYYIVSKGNVYPGKKKLFEKMLPDDKLSSFKKFVKERKIKWTEPADLLKLVDFIVN